MSRVLLIDPPLYKHPFWDPVRYAQPLGLWSIASHLESLGHEVRILCAPSEDWDHQVLVLPDGEASPYAFYGRAKRAALARGDAANVVLRRFGGKSAGAYLYVGMPLEAIAREVAAFAPNLVGIALVASCHHQSVIDLARGLRGAGYERPIVVGGQHATALPERVLRDGRGAIDWVVRGEAEQIMAAIADAPDNAAAIRCTPGVSYLDEAGRFRKNRRPRFFALDDIAPLRASVLTRIPMPRTPSHTLDTAGRRYTDVMFSLGCHNSCSYCYSPQMRGRVRQYSEQAVRALLEDLWAHGYRELVLQDDDLLYDRAAFLRLIRLIREYGFRWQDNGGIELELLDDELVEDIAAAGCTGLYVPVNPRRIADRFPSPRALMNIHVLRRLKAHGIYTYTSGIYGVPNLETPSRTLDDLHALRDFHLELVSQGYVDASLVFPLAALPGTRWFFELQRQPAFSVDTEDWLSYSIYVPQIRPRCLSRATFEAELVEVHRQLNRLQESLPWFSPFPNDPRRPQQEVVHA